MKKEKITITDIATVLNTSTVSVSRALSGQAGVSEDLKKKIIEKAAELGYRKNRGTELYKVLVLHQKPFIYDNNSFSYMVQGVEKSLQANGIDYHFEYIDENTEKNLILPYKLTKSTDFDGVILIGRFSIKYADFIHSIIKNLIFFTGYSPAYDYDSVWFSFMNAGYKQCKYLIDKGHKKIGFLGNKSFYRNKDKLIGISSAMEENGVDVDYSLFIEFESDYKSLLDSKINDNSLPTAFICDYDLTAFELIKYLHGKGLSVPNDISVLGSGNTDISAISIPALTTMDLNIEYACTVVVSTLIKRIENPDKPSENVAVLSQFIERDSVAEKLS